MESSGTCNESIIMELVDESPCDLWTRMSLESPNRNFSIKLNNIIPLTCTQHAIKFLQNILTHL